MTDLNFDQLFQNLEAGVATLAKTTLSGYVSQATTDGQSVLDAMKVDLQNWTQEVAAGNMTAEDLAFLLKGEQDEIEMEALKQAGLAEIQIDKFKDGLLSMIVGSVTNILKV